MLACSNIRDEALKQVAAVGRVADAGKRAYDGAAEERARTGERADLFRVKIHIRIRANIRAFFYGRSKQSLKPLCTCSFVGTNKDGEHGEEEKLEAHLLFVFEVRLAVFFRQMALLLFYEKEFTHEEREECRAEHEERAEQQGESERHQQKAILRRRARIFVGAVTEMVVMDRLCLKLFVAKLAALIGRNLRPYGKKRAEHDEQKAKRLLQRKRKFHGDD